MLSRPTLRDVARLAKVHPSTVSRVFSGHPSLREETRLRVVEAANQLGFVPNAAARTLATGVTKAVGLVLPDDVDPVYLDLAHNFASAARDRGYELIIRLASYAEGGALQAASLLLGGRVDGIVAFVMGRSASEEQQLRDAMRHASTPIVLLAESGREGDHVAIDFKGVFETLFVALFEDDLQRIAVPVGPHGGENGWLEAQVRAAWDAAQQSRQRDGAELFVENAPDSFDNARRWVRMLARRWPGPFAIVTDDSLEMARIAMALNVEGLPFPDRVTLAGGIHPIYASYIREHLWYVDWSTGELADACFERLTALIEHRAPAVEAGVVIRPRIQRTDGFEKAQQ